MKYSQFIWLCLYYTNLLMDSSEYFQHFIPFLTAALPTADTPEVISLLLPINPNNSFWVSSYQFSNLCSEWDNARCIYLLLQILSQSHHCWCASPDCLQVHQSQKQNQLSITAGQHCTSNTDTPFAFLRDTPSRDIPQTVSLSKAYSNKSSLQLFISNNFCFLKSFFFFFFNSTQLPINGICVIRVWVYDHLNLIIFPTFFFF